MYDPPTQPSIYLKNQPNFRAVGGLRAGNHSIVRAGLLYRSGDFSRVTPEEIHVMEGLGIKMIIDFRSDTEVMTYPTPEIATVQEKLRIPVVDSARHLAEKMMEENDAEGLSTILVHDYRRLIRDHQDDLREFFRVIATTKNLPLVYHCAAGKDRTGLATYLFLVVLGVSDKDARKDYMASNQYLKPLGDRMIREVIDAGNVNGEILRPLMEVRETYLDAALFEIVNRFGTVHAFVEMLTKGYLDTLKERFLSPAF